MKIGIFGAAHDNQCQHLKKHLEALGAEVLLVESQALNKGVSCSFDGSDFIYQGERLNQIGAWFLRFIIAPYPAGFRSEKNYYLYRDWQTDYLRKREQFGFALSWLLNEALLNGVPVINPPAFGTVIQLKPFQLAAAKQLGLKIPKTLITNDPEQVKEFRKNVPNLVYKPSMGGGVCHAFIDRDLEYLDQIKSSPVIFQEQIVGENIRINCVDNEIISAVTIPSDYLDYRLDPTFNQGRTEYQNVRIPEALQEKIKHLLKACHLRFSGIDFILSPEGEYYFIEANSSPIYLDIEQRTKAPITKKLAELLLKAANEPENYAAEIDYTTRLRSFVSYANPFQPHESWGGRYDKQEE